VSPARAKGGQRRKELDGRFASKQIEIPQTVLRMIEGGEPGPPSRVWVRLVSNGENARTTSLLMGIPKAKAI
jgi:hypothetical protein